MSGKVKVWAVKSETKGDYPWGLVTEDGAWVHGYDGGWRTLAGLKKTMRARAGYCGEEYMGKWPPKEQGK